jgi:hypothetical protein
LRTIEWNFMSDPLGQAVGLPVNVVARPRPE